MWVLLFIQNRNSCFVFLYILFQFSLCKRTRKEVSNKSVGYTIDKKKEKKSEKKNLLVNNRSYIEILDVLRRLLKWDLFKIYQHHEWETKKKRNSIISLQETKTHYNKIILDWRRKTKPFLSVRFIIFRNEWTIKYFHQIKPTDEQKWEKETLVSFNMLVANVEAVDQVDIVDRHHIVRRYRHMRTIYSYEIEWLHQQYML